MVSFFLRIDVGPLVAVDSFWLKTQIGVLVAKLPLGVFVSSCLRGEILPKLRVFVSSCLRGEMSQNGKIFTGPQRFPETPPNSLESENPPHESGNIPSSLKSNRFCLPASPESDDNWTNPTAKMPMSSTPPCQQ